jgi:hypothetical protein
VGGTAVGGKAVAVAVGAGGEVFVAVIPGGRVTVGVKMTAVGKAVIGVSVGVGKKTAVIVRLGVGKANGVGVAAKGRLQASAETASEPAIRKRNLRLWSILLLRKKEENVSWPNRGCENLRYKIDNINCRRKNLPRERISASRLLVV